MLDGWAGRGEVVGGDDEQGPTPKGKGPSGSPAWDNYLILSIYLYTLNSYFCIRKTNFLIVGPSRTHGAARSTNLSVRIPSCAS